MVFSETLIFIKDSSNLEFFLFCFQIHTIKFVVVIS